MSHLRCAYFNVFGLCLYLFILVSSAKDVKVPLFDQVILVEKGDPNACVFEHATELKKGELVPLTLSSHPRKAIAKQYDTERHYEEWRYIESQGDDAQNAINVRYEEFTFLKLNDDDLVFDVAFWDMRPGTPVNFVGGSSHEKTYSYGGGRDFIINDDGTIACKHYPNLVLGFNTERIVNGYFIGPHSTSYDGARSYCRSQGSELAEIYSVDDQMNAQSACGAYSCWIGFVEVGGDLHTPQMKQTWKWEISHETPFINWAPGEPNNFNGVDERNSIMNCCTERCTTCNGKWFDAPKEYSQPRPLCFKSKHVMQYQRRFNEEDDFYQQDFRPVAKIAVVVAASIVISIFVLLARNKIGPFRFMYSQVDTVNTLEAETEMVATGHAVAVASAPFKII